MPVSFVFDVVFLVLLLPILLCIPIVVSLYSEFEPYPFAYSSGIKFHLLLSASVVAWFIAWIHNYGVLALICYYFHWFHMFRFWDCQMT